MLIEKQNAENTQKHCMVLNNTKFVVLANVYNMAVLSDYINQLHMHFRFYI